MNTVIFSSYDSCRGSALILSEIPFHSPTKTNYKEADCDTQDLDIIEIEHLDGFELFDYFANMFERPISKVVMITDGWVYKIRIRGRAQDGKEIICDENRKVIEWKIKEE